MLPVMQLLIKLRLSQKANCSITILLSWVDIEQRSSWRGTSQTQPLPLNMQGYSVAVVQWQELGCITFLKINIALCLRWTSELHARSALVYPRLNFVRPHAVYVLFAGLTVLAFILSAVNATSLTSSLNMMLFVWPWKHLPLLPMSAHKIVTSIFFNNWMKTTTNAPTCFYMAWAPGYHYRGPSLSIICSASPQQVRIHHFKTHLQQKSKIQSPMRSIGSIFPSCCTGNFWTNCSTCLEPNQVSFGARIWNFIDTPRGAPCLLDQTILNSDSTWQRPVPPRFIIPHVISTVFCSILSSFSSAFVRGYTYCFSIFFVS